MTEESSGVFRLACWFSDLLAGPVRDYTLDIGDGGELVTLGVVAKGGEQVGQKDPPPCLDDSSGVFSTLLAAPYISEACSARPGQACTGCALGVPQTVRESSLYP